MKNLVLFAAVLVAASISSCGSKQASTQSEEIVIADSTVIVADSIIADSVATDSITVETPEVAE